MKHLALLCLAIAGLSGCNDDEGRPTGATCPTASPPTYADFGRTFFATYCMGCHSAAANDRHGAPAELNWDTQAEVDAHLAEIDREAASGPSATNRLMPEAEPDPTDDERKTLGEFLACERQAAK